MDIKVSRFIDYYSTGVSGKFEGVFVDEMPLVEDLFHQTPFYHGVDAYFLRDKSNDTAIDSLIDVHHSTQGKQFMQICCSYKAPVGTCGVKVLGNVNAVFCSDVFSSRHNKTNRRYIDQNKVDQACWTLHELENRTLKDEGGEVIMEPKDIVSIWYKSNADSSLVFKLKRLAEELSLSLEVIDEPLINDSDDDLPF